MQGDGSRDVGDARAEQKITAPVPLYSKLRDPYAATKLTLNQAIESSTDFYQSIQDDSDAVAAQFGEYFSEWETEIFSMQQALPSETSEPC